jgi:tRNA-specific 2-thiouridylase
VSGNPPEQKELKVKIRYRQSDKDSMIKLNNDIVEIEFLEPQFAVTPGQAAVFYLNDVCLGGGTIKERN